MDAGNDDPQPLRIHDSELSELRDQVNECHAVINQLWPFIRHWGLCGACPEAIRAMLDAGRIIGHHPSDSRHLREIVDKTEEIALDAAAVGAKEVVEFLRNSRFPQSMLRGVREAMFLELENVVEQIASQHGDGKPAA